jgi:hypothetical protein
MSVEQAKVLDYIGLDKATGDIVLTISDHLSWDALGQERHLGLLQDKINAYIGYIESGRAIERYPDANKRNYVISIVGKYEPSALGFKFLDAVKSKLDEIGCRLNFEMLADGEQS